ncbi:MAG: GH36-type glycosyl hydrolase domain-containing protein [Methylocella sp.]|nr:MAG: cellobiose phosphorylase [Hyphomicrobiales bacterium]
MASGTRSWKTPRESDLGLFRIENCTGLSLSVLPNGCIFAIEHRREDGTTMINQLLGSPVDGGIARLYLRLGGAAPITIVVSGPGAKGRFGAAGDRFVWEGETSGLRHRVTLALHPHDAAWLWCLEVTNIGEAAQTIDAILIQDIGLGDRGFLMNNEAYASQYIDHHIARHERYGPVVMSRQNLTQGGRNPWVVHGCLDGASGFATDGMQLFGPAFRDRDGFSFAFGASLPSKRLQHELACAAIQSAPLTLPPGSRAAWRFFGLYDRDHAAASSNRDLARIDAVAWDERVPFGNVPAAPVRSLVRDAPSAAADSIGVDGLAQRYKERLHEERAEENLLSFFTPDPPHNRHVVLRDKERLVTRRHGTLLRSGQMMLPDEVTLCATCWMHGVFAAQLTIGNTSFHKLFSVSRDPYNITRASGLRVLIDTGDGWRMLTVPSVFEIGLSDCRWIYCFCMRTITVRAIASGEEPAMQWRVTVEGEPCRFLVFGHLVLGERELDCAGLIEVDTQSKRFSFRPDPNWLWGQHYPHAVYHLVTSTPDAVEAIGGDELLYDDGQPRDGAYFALRTRPTHELCFAVAGSMTDAETAARLAEKYQHDVEDASLLLSARRYWGLVTRNLRVKGGGGAALDTLFPWLAHNAMVHLTVPHGLEQYTGATWGTRDVCQGPVEFLLALEHDEPVKEILRIVFAQQYEAQGDWPQWFMLEPYSIIQDKVSHGDVIVWPLKALNDYIEATNDLGFLDEKLAWRRQDTFEPTPHKDSVAAHVEKLLATVRERFIPGTHLIRYGHGDWNDSLQPVDPKMHDWMVSSWTVALLFQQLNRYAEVLRRAGRAGEAEAPRQLASEMRLDFNRFLLRDGTVAGYGLFEPNGGPPELLLHPSDSRTGLKYSLLPMTQSIIGGLFTPEQAAHHVQLIRAHLLFPDGARLIDRPVAYRGGPQIMFQRAESSSFFGREIGLMYVHAHLRYAEAMAVLGEAEALWEALQLANPIAVTDRLAQALPRQRNAYFSSSDAAFPDRYAASAEWQQVKAGRVGVEGGWRIYSSGPGLYTGILVCDVLGLRRRWGKRAVRPLLPAALNNVTAELDAGDKGIHFDVGPTPTAKAIRFMRR